jgi:hypothetical protein
MTRPKPVRRGKPRPAIALGLAGRALLRLRLKARQRLSINAVN